MKIAGLDGSLTAYGLARVVTGRIETARLTPRTRGHERLAYLMDRVARWCEGADLAVIEGVAVGRMAALGTVLDLAGLHHLTRHLLWTLGVPYAVIPPSSLKLFATGDAMADKAAMGVAAGRRFPPDLVIANSDTADALWALAAGCQYAGEPLVSLPQRQTDALTAVHATKGKRGQPKIVWPGVLGNTGPYGTGQDPGDLFAEAQ